MKIYGLSLAEISIIISLLTTIILILSKVVKWLFSICINYYTINKFENIKNELLEINNKIEELDKNIKYIQEHNISKSEYIIGCNNCKDDFDNIFVTKDELNQFSQHINILTEQININYNRMVDRIDNFLLTFMNKGK